MKKIDVIGVVGIPASYGGFESLVENLTKYEENGNDVQYTVYCSSVNCRNKPLLHNGAVLKYIPIKANGLSSIIYDMLSLFRSIFSKPDAILILGVSGCTILPFYRLFTKVKIITNIDGLEWKRNKWNRFAKLFLKMSEKAAVKFSDIIVADNDAIADYVLKEYNINATVIAYGGDHAYKFSNVSTSHDYALALCRIEPENNVELILESFSQTNVKLKFVGNWDSSHYGRELKRKYGCIANIEIIDPIYEISLLQGLREGCAFYVHGHSAGGTNPSLVEIMHFEKDIFCFDCSYNRTTTENKSVYFNDVSELVDLINNANDLARYGHGHLMGEIARRRYVWEIISKQYKELY